MTVTYTVSFAGAGCHAFSVTVAVIVMVSFACQFCCVIVTVLIGHVDGAGAGCHE